MKLNIEQNNSLQRNQPVRMANAVAASNNGRSVAQAAATFLLVSSTMVLRTFLQAEASISAASMASLAIWAADLVYSDLYFMAEAVRDSSSCTTEKVKF